MSTAIGGCLCGKVRYGVNSQPARITICHCSFCQKVTGSGYMVEPIFEKENFEMLEGKTSVYKHISQGSGKAVYVNFCAVCGTKLFLTFERYAAIVGIYAGTFDNPNWFEQTPDNTKHIFLSVAQKGSIIPAGFNTFNQHATTNGGKAIEPIVFDKPKRI